MLQVAYRESVILYSTDRRWFKIVKEVRQSTSNEGGPEVLVHAYRRQL